LLVRRFGGEIGEAAALEEFAWEMHRASLDEKARGWLDESLCIHEVRGNLRKSAAILIDLGTWSSEAEARRLFKRAANAFTKLGDWAGVAEVEMEFADLEQQGEAWKNVALHYSNAIEAAEKADDVGLEASLMRNMICVAGRLGEIEQAESWCAKAVERFVSLGEYSSAGHAFSNLAKELNAVSLREPAVASLRKAAEMFRRGQDDSGVQCAESWRGEIES